MSQNPSSIQGTATERRSQGVQRPTAPAISATDAATQSLLRKQYHDLIRQHLGDLGRALFTELTGLHFHIVWMPLEPSHDRPSLPTACSVCCRLANSSPLSHCGACGPKHQELALRAGSRGHRFTCGLGVSNYWFPISVRGLIVGIAFVQALDKANHILRQHVRKKPLAAASHPDGAARFLSRSDFDHAAHLLRLIAQNAETATLSVLRKADLTRVRQAMVAMQQEQDRLHQHIQRLLPANPQLPASLDPSPSPVVRRMLEYVHQDLGQPLTLRQCARKLGRNPAYLSGLFAQAVGLPFRVYHTELRLGKAKELLGHPDQNVKDVARAVGYTSANRFRRAFKKATGLSPRTWRATFQMPRLMLPLWFLNEIEFLESLQHQFLV